MQRIKNGQYRDNLSNVWVSIWRYRIMRGLPNQLHSLTEAQGGLLSLRAYLCIGEIMRSWAVRLECFV